MTFASDVTQLLFHELPTDTQRSYCALEEQLAACGRTLQVDAVIAGGSDLEIIIRIHEKLDLLPARGMSDNLEGAVIPHAR